MSEAAQAFQWVIGTLKNDTAFMAAATGGVWLERVPVGTTPPWGLIAHQMGTDSLTMNAVRLMNRMVLQIKAVGPSSNYAALVTMAGRIDALFKDQRNIALSGGGTMLSSYREQELAYPEDVNGVAWSHLGGLYHIDLQGS